MIFHNALREIANLFVDMRLLVLLMSSLALLADSQDISREIKCTTEVGTTCGFPFYHCSTNIHGNGVTCVSGKCVCAEGMCADTKSTTCVPKKAMTAQLKSTSCEKSVGANCDSIFHHCSPHVHGYGVYCDAADACKCGDGRCNVDGVCVSADLQLDSSCPKNVGSCLLPPHRCSSNLHGAGVYCSGEYECLCHDGTCAVDGYCVPMKYAQESHTSGCRRWVGSCETWPHHCSASIHGSQVYCNKDFQCICGDPGDGFCAFGSRCSPQKAPKDDATSEIFCPRRTGTCHITGICLAGECSRDGICFCDSNTCAFNNPLMPLCMPHWQYYVIIIPCEFILFAGCLGCFSCCLLMCVPKLKALTEGREMRCDAEFGRKVGPSQEAVQTNEGLSQPLVPNS